jgi:Xaa-Pro aminopeptidase
MMNKLMELRAELQRQGVDAVIVPRADEHLGEYVPACAERLAWLTGFTGSAGLAAVTADRACIFSDGRYILQMQAQTDPAIWERRHMIEQPAAAWLAEAGARRVGYDPRLIAEDGLKPFADAGLAMVPLAKNPIDAIWADRPAAPLAPAVPHRAELSGLDAADKRSDIAAMLRAQNQDAAVVTDPASVAWLFNLRGGDVPFTPFALGFALVDNAGLCTLFMDGAKLGPDTRAWLGNAVALAEPSAMGQHLARLAGKRVRVDSAAQPAWFAQTLRASGAEVVQGMDPCMLPKACKNEVERQGARNAHARDAVAVTRFLHWLEQAAGRETEMSAAAKLLEFRAQQDRFRGESFPAISGAGEHGAIMHYRVSPETDRPIKIDEMYLIDSGGQYADGTTDITRTVWTGPGPVPEVLRDRYTRVLRGHIAIDSLVFPVGLCGPHIDSFARAALWQNGLDFDHGTGHGVGSYLSVHEGPVSLSRAARMVPLAAGMILSNEPGFYAPGSFGIRLENLLLVREMEFPEATKPFLGFETLSFAPFDRRLIDVGQLSPAQRQWVDRYHAHVIEKVAPFLEPELQAWLGRACAPLEG